MDLSKKEKNNLDTWINLFANVTKHYTCPRECNGACCRLCSITLADFEFKRIINKHKNKKEILEQNVSITSEIIAGHEITQYEITIHPCPLLSEKGRCTGYNIRPLICKMYPFKSNSNTVPGMITVDACPVGVQIALDFTVFKTIAGTGPFASSFVIPENELVGLKHMMIDSQKYVIDTKVSNVQIPIQFLGPFAEYLKKCKKELLHSDRQILIDKINNI